MPERNLTLLLLCALPLASSAQALHAQAPTATLAGRVTDLQTGEPIAKATVSTFQGTTVVTDSDGRFSLPNLAPGPIDLRVSTVGYGLLKTRVDLELGSTLALDLRLGQVALHDTQQITVVAAPFDPIVPDAVTQATLDNTELQDLSTILANDPIRAVAFLPGVSANQDYYADFATRGAGPAHTGFYLDGVLIDRPAYALEDSGDLGSLSVIDGDLVRSLSLLSGAFPPSYGDRTGAILDVRLRDGARDRVATRFTADVLGAALTSEGPIGKAKQASWLVSGRQSYLAYITRRLGYASALTVNYSDAAGKLAWDPSAHQHFGLYGSFGATSASRTPDYAGGQVASFFTEGGSQHGMAAGHWDWIPGPATLLQSQVFTTYDHEHDTNLNGAVDLDTGSYVYGFRSDLTDQTSPTNKLQAGIESRAADQQRNSYNQWDYADQIVTPTLRPFDGYSQRITQLGAYVEDTLSLPRQRLAVTAGIRWAVFTPNAQNVWLPHASAIFKVTSTSTVSFAFGQYSQPPTALQLFGAFGTPSLHPERATHQTLAFDHSLDEKIRIHVELYNRQEHGDIYSPLTEFRTLASGQVVFPVTGPVLQNALKSYARGFEISLQRRSANRLSGWITYARSYSKYWQPGTTLAFAGDFDQRDTFSAYAAYRITRTIALSGNTRYGSGLPIPGFYTSSTVDPDYHQTVVYQLGPTRNVVRQDNFLQTDARISKVFTRRHFNLTIHGEVENLTGHANYSDYAFVAPQDVRFNRSVYAVRESTLPLLPAAGLTLEF